MPSSASWARSLAPSVWRDVLDEVGADGEAVLAGEADRVGEVVLALGVVVGDPRQRRDQELRVEGQDPGVDLVDLALLGVASFSSTIASTSPSALRTIRP